MTGEIDLNIISGEPYIKEHIDEIEAKIPVYSQESNDALTEKTEKHIDHYAVLEKLPEYVRNAINYNYNVFDADQFYDLFAGIPPKVTELIDKEDRPEKLGIDGYVELEKSKLYAEA